MLYEIFVHNPQLIYKLQFSSLKTSRSTSRHIWCESNVIMMTSYWQVHRDLFVSNVPWQIYPTFTMHAALINWHFLRSSIFLHNWKVVTDSFSQFVQLLFYVTSEIPFPLKLGPASLLHALTVLRNAYYKPWARSWFENPSECIRKMC